MPGRHINDYQMRLFMNNINKHSIAIASAKAEFSQSTGYRIKADPRFPSQKKKPLENSTAVALAFLNSFNNFPMTK